MEGIKEALNAIDINSLLTIFDIQIAIGIFIIFFVFRGLFSRLVIKIYHAITKSEKTTKESSMYKPLNKFFVFLGAWISANILPISTEPLFYINKFFKIIAIFFVFRAITSLINEESILFKTIFKEYKNKAVNNFFCKLIKVFLWMVFFVIAINEIGYDLKGFSALVTGLGIGSAAIALAAQDLVKSLLSGFVILTDKPFSIGDWVEIGTFQGTVIDITFRSTRIQSYNNSIITIPNSTVTAEYVTNWNKLPSRRFDCTLNLSLDTTSEKIKSIVKKLRVVLENNPEVKKDTVQVSLSQITAYSSDIKIFLYTKRTNYAEFLQVKQDLLCDILELVEKENIDLAYPTQTVYVKDNKKEEIENK